VEHKKQLKEKNVLYRKPKGGQKGYKVASGLIVISTLTARIEEVGDDNW